MSLSRVPEDSEAVFGLWLRRRRKALDLTQNALAQQVGCSLATIQKIESDERRPSRQIAELLARALEIPQADRETFLKVARRERRVDRLPPPAVSSAPLPRQTRPAGRSNLPAAPAPLVGRKSELAALAQLLDNPQCRLVTLVGPGGIGKTRLAIESAAARREAFIDGVYLVSLASVNSPAFILPALAGALGFSFYSSTNPRNQLLNYLSEQQMLLVLDNLEHLLEGVELVADILRRAPGLKLLATSRERLNLLGEWVFEVQGLAVPPANQVEGVEECSAVALFVQSARRAKAGFALRAAEGPVAARICRLVEGMPLAIELAASWVRVLSCQEIAREIEHNLDFLVASTRDLPERHRSLWAVFDHSWKLLSGEEQRALSQLSVFRGGFTRQAAEAVAGASLTALSSLVAKSLIRRADARDGLTYYGLHELVRQYALVQLRAAGEADELSRRLAQYYVDLAESAAPHLTRPGQVETVARLQHENDNLRAALECSLDHGEVEIAARLCRALWRFWYTCGYFDEGLQWTDRVLAAGQTLTPGVRADVLCATAALAYRHGDVSRAKALADECLTLHDEAGNQHGRAMALIYVGYAEQDTGRLAQARLRLEESLALFDAENDTFGMSLASIGLAQVVYDQGDHAGAQRLFEEALELARERGDQDTVATALVNLGLLKVLRGEPGSAADCTEALAIFRRLGNRLGLTFCLEGLAATAGMAGQPLRAARLLGAAEMLREAIHGIVTGTNNVYYQRLVALGRGNSDPGAFAASWAQGRAMTQEQAMSFALSEADREDPDTATAQG